MPNPGSTTLPPIELTFTMRPQRWLRMRGSTSLVKCTSPKTFVSNWLRTASIDTSSIDPACPYPALFTSAPTAPSAASICSTAARMDASSQTSSATILQPASARSRIASTLRALA